MHCMTWKLISTGDKIDRLLMNSVVGASKHVSLIWVNNKHNNVQ